MRRLLVEDNDRVDARESAKDLGALELVVNRALRALDGTDGAIGVDCDDEYRPEGACVLEISHMTRMQEIEHTVRKHDGAAADPNIGGEPRGFSVGEG